VFSDFDKLLLLQRHFRVSFPLKKGGIRGLCFIQPFTTQPPPPPFLRGNYGDFLTHDAFPGK
jgi:hypothetical protein